MTTLHHDDPRLTAYALGEGDAAERALIEHELTAAPELRAVVDGIRSLSTDLTHDLAAELRQAPGLTGPQRATITRAATPRTWRVVLGWGALTSAAAAAIALLVLPTVGVVREMARQDVAVHTVTQDTFVAASPEPITQPHSGLTPPPAASATAEAPLLAQREERSIQPKALAQEQAQEADVIASAPVSTPVEQPRSGQELAMRERPVSAPQFNFREDMAVPPAPSAPAVAAAGAHDHGDAKDAAGASRPAVPESALRQSRRNADAAVPAPAVQSAAKPAARADRKAPPTSTGAGFTFTPPAPSLPVVTPGGETYNQRSDHIFRPAQGEPLSTFGLDVDTASYGNVRRLIEGGRLPPRDAVRVEEMVNYFPYDDVPAPADGQAFGVTVEVAPCPWEPSHQLARIAVRGQAPTTRPPLNLVFLVDVSGSMKPDNRLPLIKTGLTLLANSLTEHDRVTIVTYAGAAGVALPTTAGTDQRTILKAIDRLTAEGGTNGGSGIQLAYDAARAALVQGGVNRVVLCTDGDFNVGVTNRDELVRLVQARAKEGVFLTVLGVGQDNLKDATMELLADKANGHYHYLDTIAEARKVLVEQLSGTLVTIAKDAKAQVEFNPARIAAWRQLGYEKRQLANQDFANDRKDGGEIGAGHLVTVLYELVPVGLGNGTDAALQDGLRYQSPARPAAVAAAGDAHHGELLTVKLRYQAPTGSVSRLVEGVVTDEQVRSTPSSDQRFAAAVAAFALRLRQSEAMGLDFPAIASEARQALGRDPQEYRREFVELVERAAALDGRSRVRE